MLIYRAENNITHKVYIGQTSKTLKRRKFEHENDTTHMKNTIFHKALRRYGFENFTWEVIDTAKSKLELNEKERYWISFYKSTSRDFGYNQTEGGTGGAQPPDIIAKIVAKTRGRKAWNKGLPRTSEEKEKMSKSHMGQKAWNKGIPLSDEQKEKLSKAMKGRPSAWKGCHPTEEQHKRMVENHPDFKGKNHPKYGTHCSEETKRKISESLKKRARTQELVYA